MVLLWDLHVSRCHCAAPIVRDLRSHCWSDMAAKIGAEITSKMLARKSLKFKSAAFRVQLLQSYGHAVSDKHVELHLFPIVLRATGWKGAPKKITMTN